MPRNYAHLGFVKKKKRRRKTAPKRHKSQLSQSSPSLCEAGKTIPIWGSLEQIRIVSTVGFYLLNREDG